MSLTYTVVQGDCISSIAAQYGFGRWQTLWDRPENAALKETRKNPNALLPGDQVFVPDVTAGSAVCATDQTHTFRLKRAPTRVRIQVVDGQGQPYASAAFTIVIDGDDSPGATKRGTTGSDGLIDVPIPSRAATATLHVVPRDGSVQPVIERQLRLGYLDPATETSGALARLENLFPTADLDLGIADDDRIKALLTAFQEMNGLAETGELDADTAAKLEQLHDTLT